MEPTEQDKIARSSEIKLNVQLNEENLPINIEWQAQDSEMTGVQDCKAFLLALWDAKEKNALRIDLWTKDMQVDEMNLFFFQTLMTMSDTYHRATGNKELAGDMKSFAHHFGLSSEAIAEDPDVKA